MFDEFERLPGGGGIFYGELRKFRNGEPFTVFLSSGEDFTIEYNSDVLDAYSYYFKVWDNCREFGLPIRDWTENPTWLVNHVKRYNNIFEHIESYRANKRH